MSKKILLLGGNGFVGRSLAIKLSKLHQDYTLLATSRKENWHPSLKVLPQLSRITVDEYNATTLKDLLQGVDIVINCIGIIQETSSSSFRSIHAGLMRNLIEAVNTVTLPRLIHISASGADANAGKSRYLRSKGEGEMYLHTYINSHTHVTTYRPSLLYGKTDASVTLWAALIRLAPVFYPEVASQARLAPIYIEDFISLLLSQSNDPTCYGKRLDVFGPDDLSIAQINDCINSCFKDFLGIRRKGIPLPEFANYIVAFISELLPKTLISVDNLKSLQAEPNRMGNHVVCKTRLADILPYILELKHNQHTYNQLRRTTLS